MHPSAKMIELAKDDITIKIYELFFYEPLMRVLIDYVLEIVIWIYMFVHVVCS